MLIFDIEIKNAILGKNEKPEPNITYCNGFDDFENMGIAVICAYDYEERSPRIFLEDNLTGFQELVTHHTENDSDIISFNGNQFDIKLLDVNGIIVPESSSYDLLAKSWRAAGHPPEFNSETHKGYGLSKCAQANGIDIDKRHDSARAPIDFQSGSIGKVIDHCMTDVMILKWLIDQVISFGEITDPKTSEQLIIDKPLWCGDSDYQLN